MYGIDAALDGLRIIRVLNRLRNGTVLLRRSAALHSRRLWLFFWRSQVGPDHLALLHRRIGFRANFIFEIARGRFVRQVHASAGDIEFPAMINTAKTIFFIAS